MEVKERDWKLFRKKLPGWQTAYMDRLNREYEAILQDEAMSPADKFWKLEKRIRNDKRDVGVIAEMSRSVMVQNLVSLVYEGAITLEDLDEFSDELKEKIRFITEDV